MIIRSPKKKENKTEQKEKEYVSNFIFDSVKKLLEKDQFQIFDLRRSVELDRELKRTNKEIDKLIKLKIQGSEQVEKLTSTLVVLENENAKAIEYIKRHINAD